MSHFSFVPFDAKTSGFSHVRGRHVEEQSIPIRYLGLVLGSVPDSADFFPKAVTTAPPADQGNKRKLILIPKRIKNPMSD